MTSRRPPYTRLLPRWVNYSAAVTTTYQSHRVRRLFEDEGLAFRAQCDSDDALDRPGFEWVTQVFMRP